MIPQALNLCCRFVFEERLVKNLCQMLFIYFIKFHEDPIELTGLNTMCFGILITKLLTFGTKLHTEKFFIHAHQLQYRKRNQHAYPQKNLIYASAK